MVVGDVIDGNARRCPDRVAWTFQGTPWTWSTANERVNRLADSLLSFGLAHEDRVAFLSHNSHRLAEVYFALAKAGLIAVPINAKSVSREIAFILQDVEARALLVSKEFVPRLGPIESDLKRLRCVIGLDEGHGLPVDYEDLLSSASPSPPSSAVHEDSIRAIKYTSGTTGFPKGSISTHKQFLFNITNYLLHLPFTPEDRCLLALPMPAGVGAQLLAAYAYRACQTFILEKFDPAQVLDAIERERITRIYLVPTMIAALVNEMISRPRDLSSVRLMGYGGSPAPMALIRKAMEVLGCPFYQSFGASETGGFICYFTPEDHQHKLGSGCEPADFRGKQVTPCGREAQGFHIRIVNSEGNPLRAGEVGEMVVRGDSLMSGYWRRPQETREVLRDGWLFTGDMAKIDAEGYIHIVDRKRDMIISGGLNVYSAEVESVIQEHPAVSEVAVVGVPDPYWGEAVRAFVVRKKGETCSAEELLRFCADNLASYKRPQSIVFLEALPKTSSGKVLKVQLRSENWGEKLSPDAPHDLSLNPPAGGSL
ncbi:MAG: long-chain-fatty-acid--CoA ligase [Candidatus Tectomicrobia bacterium]|uniref:Long-chain-fatty-acid--CoA ligase n=1 Tax=Tectimicrobiota bacterium TaxID=2528274 RepID=A0A932GN46_UNCTE|nr:long-chain-fatty-acid--CoA ligase [Candidatus Tectomicrobia bacterium]